MGGGRTNQRSADLHSSPSLLEVLPLEACRPHWVSQSIGPGSTAARRHCDPAMIGSQYAGGARWEGGGGGCLGREGGRSQVVVVVYRNIAPHRPPYTTTTTRQSSLLSTRLQGFVCRHPLLTEGIRPGRSLTQSCAKIPNRSAWIAADLYR